MGEDVANQNAVLAVAPELRPIRRDRIIKMETTALDLLPDRDRTERLGARKEGEQGIRSDQFAALRVREARDKIEDEPAALIDGERCTREEPQWTELSAEALSDSAPDAS